MMHENVPLKYTRVKDGGFTLIEVLIVMVLLAFGLLGMASLTLGIMNGNRHSGRMTIATTLVQEKLEDIRRLGYAGTPSSDTTSTEDYNSIAGYPYFKRVTVTDVGNPSATMKTIAVSVSWGSDSRSVTARSILAE